MKCVKNGTEIKRVKDEEAFKMVKKGWAFCKKSEWKNKATPKAKVEKDAKDAKDVTPVDTEKQESEKKAKKVYASKKSIREEKKAKKEGK